MNPSAQLTGNVLPPSLPWHRTPPGTEWERELAAVALHFAESLELPVVLGRVAQCAAALFGGLCQVRFAPAYRPQEARRASAGSPEEPVRCRTNKSGETYANLLTRQGEQTSTHASQDAPEDQAGEALLMAPLVARGRRIGAITLVIHAPFGYDLSAGQRQLRALAAHAALAIDTADQFAQLRPRSAESTGKPEADEHAALLSMLAHDLKGPLTALSSSIQMLMRTTKGGQELEADKMARLIEIAEAAIGQLETQVDTLTPLTAAERSGSGDSLTPLDLVGLVRLLAHFYQQTTDRHQLLVVEEVAELTGPWSRGKLERVVGNLLANAIKYSPAGGEVQITVGREEDESGSWATFSVRNHGIGIPASDMSQLSQPGYRAKNVGTIPGTGLGLASVREVVEQYGGTCAIKSAPGETTIVWVRLPLAGAAQGLTARKHLIKALPSEKDEGALRRYTCPRELLPVIESALAVKGYVAVLPPQQFDGGVCVTVISRGAAAVALHEAPNSDMVQVNVYGDAAVGELSVLEEELPRLFPPALGELRTRELGGLL